MAQIIPGVNLPTAAADDAALQNILTFIFALAGMVAVIFVLIGAVKFTTSAGDPQRIASGRNTIIYALVGLGISMLSLVIVSITVETANEAAGAGNPLFGPGGLLTTLVSWLGYAIGAGSVIMIVVGGLRFITAAGQPQAAQAARNTVVYAIVGLVIAMAAGFLVTFVLNRLG